MLLEVVGIKLGVELDALVFLLRLEDFLEVGVIEAQHDVGIHLDEAAIGVIGKTRIAGEFAQAFRGFRVEAEIEHRIHHARHRDARARAHRNQQRIADVAQFGVHLLADLGDRFIDLLLQLGRIGLPICIIVCADLGGDGEARRDGKTQIAHLGQVGALAAQQIFHFGFAFGVAVSERINPFGHWFLCPC